MKRTQSLHLVFAAFMVSVIVNGATKAAADAGLHGRWRLTSMTGYGGPLLRQDIPTVTFGRDGQLGGYDGCNTFGGRWRLGGDRIAAPDLIQTVVACKRPDDPDLQARGRAFVGAFDSATVRRKGDALTLVTPSGRRLTLRREKAR